MMSETAHGTQDIHRLLVIHLRGSADIMERVAEEFDDLGFGYSANALRGQVRACRAALRLAEGEKE